MLATMTIQDMQRHVDDFVYAFTKGVVQTGPFQGMHLTRDIAWADTKLSPQLLGCYEMELHEFIEKCIEAKPKVVVNVGCAEGYYAVGLAHRLPDATVYAIEGDETSVDIAKAAAERNGVKLVFGEDVDKVFAAPDLIVMDCEGHEVLYLDLEKFPSLRTAVIIVEIHEMPAGSTYFPDGQPTAQIIVDRFRETHKIVALFEGPRNPNQFKCLHCISSLERWMAVQEGRPCLMCWFIMVPREKLDEATAQD